MKKIVLWITVFLIAVLFSCKKSLSKSEYFENETYKLLNEAIIPELDNERTFPKELVDSKQFYLYPNKYLREDQPERFKSIYNNFFHKMYKSSFPDSLLFKKWDITKLPNTIKYVDSITWYNLFKLWKKQHKTLDSIFMKNDYTMEQASSIYSSNKLAKQYSQAWKEKIGKSFSMISYPYFNETYTKAMIKIEVFDGLIGVCGFGETLTYLIKENNKWRILSNDELKLIQE